MNDRKLTAAIILAGLVKAKDGHLYHHEKYRERLAEVAVKLADQLDKELKESGKKKGV